MQLNGSKVKNFPFFFTEIYDNLEFNQELQPQNQNSEQAHIHPELHLL
jgi:hypothetical protein